MRTWQVQEAKARFSELMESAEKEGPQSVTRHGRPRVVVISAEAYAVLQKGKKSQDLDFIDVLLHRGPKFDDFEIDRSKDTGREIDLE